MYLSLNYWLKKLARAACGMRMVKGCLKDYLCTAKSKEDTPAWVTEIYQLSWVAVGLSVLFSADSTLKLGTTESTVLAWVFGYRILEITQFALHWVLVNEKPIHSYQRSLLGFLLNLCEIGIFFTVLGHVLALGEQSPDPFMALVDHIRSISSLTPVECKSKSLACSIYSMSEMLITSFLIVVVIGVLAGQITYKLKNSSKTGLPAAREVHAGPLAIAESPVHSQ